MAFTSQQIYEPMNMGRGNQQEDDYMALVNGIMKGIVPMAGALGAGVPGQSQGSTPAFDNLFGSLSGAKPFYQHQTGGPVAPGLETLGGPLGTGSGLLMNPMEGELINALVANQVNQAYPDSQFLTDLLGFGPGGIGMQVSSLSSSNFLRPNVR